MQTSCIETCLEIDMKRAPAEDFRVDCPPLTNHNHDQHEDRSSIFLPCSCRCLRVCDHECHCGSHKDACGCCDFCNKCANEECHPEHNDKCAEGHHCVVKPAGDDHGHATGTGHCEPVESSTGHDGTHGHDGAHGHNETHGHDGAHGHDETHGHAATPDSETPAQDGGDSAHHE
ncbi:hypothetical protein V5799_012347 [Amblyomma americanum]|uniref:Secreted protein n=1 Tax=Amblyomma americanum TaxID=6943 RepID=A0AAQ4EEP4_AMBAM